MFANLFRGSRLRRIERKLKSLHFRQRDVRERIDAAEKAGEKDRLAALKAEREAITREIGELHAEQKRLKPA